MNLCIGWRKSVQPNDFEELLEDLGYDLDEYLNILEDFPKLLPND